MEEVFGRKVEEVDISYFRGVTCHIPDDKSCSYDGEGKPHYMEYGWILRFPNIPYDKCIEVGKVMDQQ